MGADLKDGARTTAVHTVRTASQKIQAVSLRPDYFSMLYSVLWERDLPKSGFDLSHWEWSGAWGPEGHRVSLGCQPWEHTEGNTVANLNRNSSNHATTGRSEHVRTPAPVPALATAQRVSERLAGTQVSPSVLPPSIKMHTRLSRFASAHQDKSTALVRDLAKQLPASECQQHPALAKGPTAGVRAIKLKN